MSFLSPSIRFGGFCLTGEALHTLRKGLSYYVDFIEGILRPEQKAPAISPQKFLEGQQDFLEPLVSKTH